MKTQGFDYTVSQDIFIKISNMIEAAFEKDEDGVLDSDIHKALFRNINDDKIVLDKMHEVVDVMLYEYNFEPLNDFLKAFEKEGSEISPIFKEGVDFDAVYESMLEICDFAIDKYENYIDDDE